MYAICEQRNKFFKEKEENREIIENKQTDRIVRTKNQMRTSRARI